MLLHELGRDVWRVLAIARSETECELKDVLAKLDPNDLGSRMIFLLRRAVPSRGPSHNEEISKQLDGDIYEFRKTPRRGPALRVLWFYDEGRVIVCTHGYWKTTQATPRAEIDKARRLRTEYLIAKRAGVLRMIFSKW